jgi:hypothetical protein
LVIIIKFKKKKTWKGQNLEGTKKMVVVTILDLECSVQAFALYDCHHAFRKTQIFVLGSIFCRFTEGFLVCFNIQVGETEPILQEDENY